MKRKWVRNWGAPNVTHSAISCTLVPLSTSCCDKLFEFSKFAKAPSSSANIKTMKIQWKYV